MRVTKYETVDVEVDAIFLFGDVLEAFGEAIDSGELLPSLDWMTRILARVSDEAIASMPDEARREMLRRLDNQRVRYESPGCGMAVGNESPQ